MFEWARRLIGGQKYVEQVAVNRLRRKLLAKYDAAMNGPDAEHWKWADSLNANAANNPAVRKTLRERSRYECENNGYAGGLIDKLSKDMVGTIPRLQLSIPGVDRKTVRAIIAAFNRWAVDPLVNLGETLRLLDSMAIRDGAGFGMLESNEQINDDVKLAVRLYEDEQVHTPFIRPVDPMHFDGGILDKSGNVVVWHFLKFHPGSDTWGAATGALEKVDVKPSQVIHWYRPRRAGQLRGIPETTSSLTLYAYLRRYTLATVTAAEFAASLAGVMTSPTLPGVSTSDLPEHFDQFPLVRGKLLSLPEGYDAKQFEPKQPISTYREFKGELLTEGGAGQGAPRNISTGSSAEYNYSSAKLDHGIYQHGMRIRRHDFAVRVLNRIFWAWLDEASSIPGLLPPALPGRRSWTLGWFYDGFPSMDEEKDAKATHQRLNDFTTSLSEVYGEFGQNWEEHLEQIAEEYKRMEELGILQHYLAMRGAGGATGTVTPAQTETPAGDNVITQVGAA